MGKCLVIVGLLLSLSGTAYAANKYYCPESDGSFIRMRDVYDANQDCSSFNNDFFGKETYNECLAEIKAAKRKYLQGKCEPIVVKTHVFGACKGEALVAPKSKKVLEYHTSGGDCMDKLKSLYKDYEY